MVLVVISHFIAGKILEPIGKMKELTKEISEKNLDQRIPTGPGRDSKFFNAIRPALPEPMAIFTAPLPVGSGARALGLAGAFTAIADDATAASWNPAGLVQLERPELSAVGMFSFDRQELSADDPDLRLRDESFSNQALNYASAVLPFRLLGANLVTSLNYQQIFDYTQRFSLDQRDLASRAVELNDNFFYPGEDRRHYDDGITRADITIETETRTRRNTAGMTTYSTLQGVKFRQDGSLYALSPALAVEVTPRFSVGAACNFFGDDPFLNRTFKSSTRSRYSGTSSFSGDIFSSSIRHTLAPSCAPLMAAGYPAGPPPRITTS
jgi:hypothetical protein